MGHHGVGELVEHFDAACPGPRNPVFQKSPGCALVWLTPELSEIFFEVVGDG